MAVKTSSDLPKSRRHVWIYDEDWELLLRLYGPGSVSRMGASEAVREVVHRRCKALRQKNEDLQDAALEAEALGEAEEIMVKGVVDL